MIPSLYDTFRMTPFQNYRDHVSDDGLKNCDDIFPFPE